MIPQPEFDALLAEAGLSEYAHLYPALSQYCALLLDWNTRMNLTAITGEREVAVKHFIDSLLPLRLADLPHGASLVDVGTGAGFPGVVLKLARPDLKLTLLDSLQKRLTFLEAVCAALGTEAALVHARAEDAGRSPVHRERYDLAVSRGVANLAALAEYCLPLVKAGGLMLALKGPAARDELSGARRAIALCGGGEESLTGYALPGGDERILVSIKKLSHTSTDFPRTATKIARLPL